MDASAKFQMGDKFFANEEYKEQLKRTSLNDEMDQFGNINIPSEKSFWVIVNGRGVYFLSSRRDAITKFKHFTPHSGLKRGPECITDLGQFDEGFCA
jgi:hypothetical protein